MSEFDYNTFLSPFTWRYGTQQMRTIWSEVYKRKLWRRIWIALAQAQQQYELVSEEEIEDLKKYKDAIAIDQAHEIEKEIHHDLMAEITVFAKQATIGGGKLHLGATSMDIEDNADTIRERESLILLEEKLTKLLQLFSEKIVLYQSLVCMGYTHLQPAEPTTLGYRFALYAQDLLTDLKLLRFVKQELKGKGIKGAVGTSASYTQLLDTKRAGSLETAVMEQLHITAVPISSQTAPRKIECLLSDVLTGIAQSLYKFAFDIRIMQSPGFGELQEPFGKRQVGSSAMPFKRNPIKSEQICSLSRLIFHLADVTRDNASHMLLERTLDDSANRRSVLPELFLATDEILTSATKILDHLVINTKQIEKNLATYGPFAATERILMEAVKKGADRQKVHEAIRDTVMQAYALIQDGKRNPLTEMLQHDTRITVFLDKKKIKELLDPTEHIGRATIQCKTFIQLLQNELSS